mmetsp:Transcript_12541/g.28830  ORF Transcript_12541/g.28830 Transcript_12541/m.28830 type:complete len:242 (-) Transcript_12541:42-767(-)
MTSEVVTVRGRTKNVARNANRRVNLDLPTLERLFEYRQEDAAAMLGISMTSLKIACRRLGVQRWPYSRSRNLEQRDEASGSQDSTNLHASGSGDSIGAGSMDEAMSSEGLQLSVEVPLLSPTETYDSAEQEQQGCEEEVPSIDQKWMAWYMRCDDFSPIFREEEMECRQVRSCPGAHAAPLLRRQSFPACQQECNMASSSYESRPADFFSSSFSSSYPGSLPPPNTVVAEACIFRSFSSMS